MTFEYTRSATLPRTMAGMPLVPLSLYYAGHDITHPALVDSGSTLSILPYDIGLQLGLVWKDQTHPVMLGGIYKNMEACMVLVRGEISDLPPVALVFAWVDKPREDVRLIVGQTNFFQRFKVTFEAYSEMFDISPRP
jgi:hypothetical protein